MKTININSATAQVIIDLLAKKIKIRIVDKILTRQEIAALNHCLKWQLGANNGTSH